jgi:DNA-binding PadR family transcriptional regulator
MERVAETWSREMRRGYLKLAVLTIISKNPASGYTIMKEFHKRTLGFWKMTTSSVYPILQELTERKYIDGVWETHGKRRRKVYTITPLGLQLLEAAIKKQRQIAETIGILIQEYAHEILDTDLPQPSLPFPMDILSKIEHIEKQPIEEQIRILTCYRDQLQTLITRINQLLMNIHKQR